MTVQFLRLLKGLVVISLVASCGQKSDVDKAEGTIQVDVPVQKNSNSFVFKTVQLFGIESLKEVSGKFARFFYTPGAEETRIIGDAPKARFIKSGDRFIPMDAISNQMAVIYYHLQNMAQLDDVVGAAGVNHWPRSIGLDTILANVPASSQKNNAFYDGSTDSMMFLPYTADELPIAANGGVIAHEHFHSLFYKIVLKVALNNKDLDLFSNQLFSIHNFKINNSEKPTVIFRDEKLNLPLGALDNSKIVSLMNRVYLLGLNEGLADFWAWVYSDDANYINWSIPSEKTNRTLELSAGEDGKYRNNKEIESYVRFVSANYGNPNKYLAAYYYEVGTPHARFLRQLSLFVSEQQGKPLSEVKIQMAQKVIQFLKVLARQTQSMKSNQVLPADALFQFFSEDSNLVDTKACDFILKYVKKANCGISEKP